MLRGRPLFTGENTIEQINYIRGALAEPTSQGTLIAPQFPSQLITRILTSIVSYLSITDLHYCDSGLVRSVFNYPPHRE